MKSGGHIYFPDGTEEKPGRRCDIETKEDEMVTKQELPTDLAGNC